MSVLVSCEVGGHSVPPQLRALISSATASKQKKTKRRGSDDEPYKWTTDEAATYAAKRMSEKLYAPLVFNGYANELIDVSRSLHHRQLFSPLTRDFGSEDRQQLIDLIHAPYRDRVRASIEQLFRHFSYVIHLSVRTFPLYEKGKLRRADVGLLYDPSADDEVDLCLDWIDEMYEEVPMLRVRRNYPRRGTCDSITRTMRSEFSGRNYIGIEVLLNRAWCGRRLPVRDEVLDGMCSTLHAITTAPQSDAA